MKAPHDIGRSPVTLLKAVPKRTVYARDYWMQLHETTMSPDTRRLVQLRLDAGDGTNEMLDMLLAKKRAGDRKSWLEEKGDLAEIF
ncbi:MAG: hypothetical protein Cons2KO_01030 [Congregibacter sp.]